MAADAGFDGIAIGADCGRGDVAPLCAASLAVGLAVPVMSGGLPEGPLGPGRRVPYLASLDDSDERRAAVALFTSALDLAAPFGVRTLTVHLGELSLAADSTEVAYRFARRQLEEDEPGARVWAAAVGERRAVSPLVLDACRYALDRIVPRAERRDVKVALEVAGGPWSSPSPREALYLLDEYRDGPLGLVWDEARMQMLATLGLAPPQDRRAALAAGAIVWCANDAVGIEIGYLPGLGDPPAPNHGELEPVRADGVPVVVTGRPESTAAEVAAARARVASRVP
jgi:hypothetical protein